MMYTHSKNKTKILMIKTGLLAELGRSRQRFI
jgi:hypothetical protein